MTIVERSSGYWLVDDSGPVDGPFNTVQEAGDRKKMAEQFPKGATVDVEHRPGDMFNHDFTGNVIGYNDRFVSVEDQDGDVWDCLPAQLTVE